MINSFRKKSRTSRHYLLSGKIYCGVCGAKYRYQKWGKRIVCYCYSKQKSKPKFVKDPNCNNKNYDSYILEDCILESIFSLNFDDNFMKNDYGFDIKNDYEKKIISIDKKINNLLSNICNNVAVDITNEKIKGLECEKKIIKNMLDSNINEKITTIKSLADIWNFMPFEEKKIIIEFLIDKIVVNNNIIDIYYNLAI